MKEKNPYENGVDIPDFVESKDSNIDKSLFKIVDEEAQEEFERIEMMKEFVANELVNFDKDMEGEL